MTDSERQRLFAEVQHDSLILEGKLVLLGAHEGRRENDLDHALFRQIGVGRHVELWLVAHPEDRREPDDAG